MDKQQTWLEAVTSPGFSYDSFCARRQGKEASSAP